MFNSFGLFNNKDAQNSYENVICFKNYFVKKTLGYQNVISMLWMATSFTLVFKNVSGPK